MKFLDDCDVHIFLLEIGESKMSEDLNKSYIPTDEEIQSFLKVRRKTSSIIKDHKKASDQKANWRKNRYKMMSGIRAFHKSTEGKRFHKRLGRFLATRITGNGKVNTTEALKGVSSLKTSLYAELEYYHIITEQIALEEMIMEYAISMLNSIEDKIIKDVGLDEDETDFLINITERLELLRSFADKSGKNINTVERYWKEIKDALLKKGHSESDEKFYGLLVSILKKKLELS